MQRDEGSAAARMCAGNPASQKQTNKKAIKVTIAFLSFLISSPQLLHLATRRSFSLPLYNLQKESSRPHFLPALAAFRKKKKKRRGGGDLDCSRAVLGARRGCQVYSQGIQNALQLHSKHTLSFVSTTGPFNIVSPLAPEAGEAKYQTFGAKQTTVLTWHEKFRHAWCMDSVYGDEL